jgi:voltage-gated potassium channel
MRSGNFKWLLLGLIIFLIGVPLADEFDAIGKPLARALTFSTLLGIGILSLRGAGRLFDLAMFFVLAGLILNVTATALSSPLLILTSFASITGFLVTAIFYTFKRIATETNVSANRIIGAIVVYLLLGVLWSVGYTMVELSSPGSFRGFDVGGHSEWDSEWLYFSFVTMTTLGYGDIAPVSALARVLAYMQAVVGQFYIAILVAGLVSAHISQRGRDH